MGRFVFTAAVVLSLGLTACDPPAQPPGGESSVAAQQDLSPFVDAADVDVSGYYLPVEQIGVDGWMFHHLFMGQKGDFDAWRQGHRDGVFAPVMIEFEDQNSPMVTTELGETRSGRDRILPTAYRVTDAHVVFEGRSERLGLVRLEGDLDADGLAEARRNLGDETPVLTGTLTVAGRANPVRLRWWAGD